MKKICSIFILTFFAVSVMVSSGQSQDAKVILEKTIEAQGGREALKSIKDTTSKGSMEMIQMGLNATMMMYQKEPDKIRMDMEAMGMVITQAFDGQTAWMINPQSGIAEEMPEQFKEEFKRSSIGNGALLDPEKYGISYNFKGKEKIEDIDYFVLEQGFSDGHKASLYINPETFLLYKTSTTTINQMGIEVESETFSSDYKKVDGVMIPFTIRIFQEGEEFMTLTIEEIHFNTGLEDSLFKMSE